MNVAKTFGYALLIFVILIGGLIGWYHLTYNREFNALRSTLEQNRYEIIDQWRHEDISLEDFGFTARTQVGDFAIDILDGSDVRTPSDRITGIYIRFAGKKMPAAQPVAFDSDYWRSLHLPKMDTLADLLKHMPQTLAALRTSPPTPSTPDAPRMDFPYKPYAVLKIPAPPATSIPQR